jgi:hypothetical protein
MFNTGKSPIQTKAKIYVTPFLYVNPPKEAYREATELTERLAKKMEEFLQKAKKGTFDSSRLVFTEGAAYRSVERGFHTSDDGTTSTNQDYLLEGDRYVTNSLAPHYITHYFEWLSDQEILKLEKVGLFK